MKKLHPQDITSLFVKLVLFLSSYIPLILIMILQTLRVSLENLNSPLNFSILRLSTWNNLLTLKYVYHITILIFISIVLIILLKLILCCTKDTNLTTEIEIQNINNINSNYITNYLSVYIFPFITLNMTQFDGIGTVIILTIIIGYVYITNDILYINPILNILFHYNIYSVEIIDNNKFIDLILLSRNKRTSLKTNPYVSAYRIGYNVFIEL